MRRRLKAACAILVAFVAASPALAQSFDLVKLIRNADPGVKDAGGWAADMLSGFADNGIEANRENICSTIAIISQESGFVANPAVPGLGRLAEKALAEKFGAVPFLGPKVLAWLETVPDARRTASATRSAPPGPNATSISPIAPCWPMPLAAPKPASSSTAAC